jgi:pimeloyl-ACP methyl ester carboxylesterase
MQRYSWGIVLGFLLAVVCPQLADSHSFTSDRYAVPGAAYGMAGKKLNFYCIGAGKLAVIMDAGLGDWSPSWTTIHDAVARLTTVCTFDRAGYGFSDTSSDPRTSSEATNELYSALMSSPIKPPYILVGHSYGGMNARLFANRHLADVAGMVLVDSVSERQNLNGLLPMFKPWLEEAAACRDLAARGTLARDAAQHARCEHDVAEGFPANLLIHFSPSLQQRIFANSETPPEYAAIASELQSLPQSSRELAGSSRSYGDLPLIVLTAPSHADDSSQKATAFWENFERDWRAGQDEMAKMSRCSLHIMVPRTHHMIQVDRPDAVVQAIQTVVDRVRGTVGRGDLTFRHCGQ